jgi:colanic acid biosynthesis glycosyl transferase WcaI
MRILFLTHYYPPEVNAPASRVSEMARVWAAAGHEVTVVTAAPSHPKGKIYPGYRNRLFQQEERDGVRILRIWTVLAPNEGSRRALSFLSYPLSVLANLWRIPPSDVVISTSPQFFCGLAGIFFRRRRRPWVLEIRDLWPESIVVLGAMKRGLVIRTLEWVEKVAYRSADALVSVTDSFVPHIQAVSGRDGTIEVIKNGVDLSFFTTEGAAEAGPRLRSELGLEGKFVAAYVGTHGMAHGLESVLEAATLLADEPDIAFLLVGEGSERQRLLRMRAERGLTNVHIVGQRPKSDMPGIWELTDVSLVLLRRLDMFKSVLPSKMFEAMAMRRPMILGVEGEARALLDAAGAGIGIVPEDAAELADAVRTFARDPQRRREMGEAGRRHVEEHFDRDVIARRYAAFLAHVVDQSRAST